MSGLMHYALLFEPGFGFAQALAVRATRHAERGDALVLYDGDRVVWRGPRRVLREVVPCDTQLEADDKVREHMEALRTSGFHGAVEGGAVTRRPGRGADPASGAVTEGISVVVEGSGPAKPRGSSS